MFLAFGLQFILVYHVSQRIITVHNGSFNVFCNFALHLSAMVNGDCGNQLRLLINRL